MCFKYVHFSLVIITLVVVGRR